MHRYERSISTDSSKLIRRSKTWKSGDKLAKSTPKSIYIRKVGNQVINIHNTTIQVGPTGFGLDKPALSSPKRTGLKRRREYRLSQPSELQEYQQNFKIIGLSGSRPSESRAGRSQTLQSKNVKKYQHRHYKTLDVEPRQLDDQSGLISKTIQDQLDSVYLDMDTMIQCNLDWRSVKVPLTPQRTLKRYSRYLTGYENKEIFHFPEIYFIGHQAHKVQVEDSGFDNEDGEYRLVVKDHIGYRYQIVQLIGAGAFGQCVKVFDHKTRQVYAVKLARNKPNFAKQGLVELNILKYIAERDTNLKANVVKIVDSLTFRKHLCIVTELLDVSLYDFLKLNNFQGFTSELVRKFAVQILQGLFFLKSHGIVHCDLKPENILLKKLGKSGIKIIDFGTSCFIHQKYFTYIQSRFYRAPEIVLGIPYDTSLDMWSFGCIITEMFTGAPLFPGESEQEHIRLMVEVVGQPPVSFLKKCAKANEYFDSSGHLLEDIINSTKSCVKNIPKLSQLLKGQKDLHEMLKRCLAWDPAQRIQPREALLDKFVIEGLPPKIRQEHIKQMSQASPYGLA